MLRLFGLAGLLVTVSAVLALSTGATTFKVSTVILAVAVIGGYTFLRRSMPRRRGPLTLPGLKDQVDVYYDDRGVPHIYANNLHDLYMAQGYVTAQDRLWAMDLHRRIAGGRMAERFGSKLLPLDRHFRTLGLRRAAEASLPACSTETRAALDAYAAGVNARITEGRLPPEFTLLRYEPDPWTTTDTLTLGKYSAYYMVGNWDRELFRAKLVQTVGADKAAELFWLPPDPELLHLLEQTSIPNVDDLLALAAATSHESSGTNGWVAAGSRTRSGAPILANDPHLAASNPAMWYQTHLVGPSGMDVIGATFPGVPGILLGRNRDIAWGATNLNADTQDIYLERVNPAALDEFLFEGTWEKATRIPERIYVKGRSEPILHDVLVTRHGPVIARAGDTALSLKWTALEPSAELDTFLAINQARSWPEFREALRPFAAPAQHFLFAGRDGTIACRSGGKIPLRAGGDGQTLLPGWTGTYEWSGSVPFEELPEAVNPTDGFVDAGHCDALCEYNVGATYLPPYRTMLTAERLRQAADLTTERMEQLQSDCVNNHARSLLQTLLNAVQEGLRQGTHPEVLNEMEKRALLMLSGWNCCEGPEAPEPLLWHQWYVFLLEGIFRSQMGLTLFDQFVACGMPMQMTDRLIWHAAAGGDSAWLTKEGEGSLGRIALRSFRRTVKLLSAKHGSHPERWRWGREHTVTFEHPLTQRLRPLRHVLNFGPFPLGGSAITVDNQGFSQLNPFRVTVAASWRHVVDLGNPDGARDICAPGQSGHPLSPHHSDQMATWLRGESFPQVTKLKIIRELPCLVLKPH